MLTPVFHHRVVFNNLAPETPRLMIFNPEVFGILYSLANKLMEEHRGDDFSRKIRRGKTANMLMEKHKGDDFSRKNQKWQKLSCYLSKQ